MIGITPLGIVIGVVAGVIALVFGIRLGQVRAGINGLIVCVVAGFGCGIAGGLIALLVMSAVTVSHAYVDKQDPFTSRAKLEDIDFSETRTEAIMRQLANFGGTVRASWRALLRNKAGFIGFLGVTFFLGMSAFGPLFVEYEGSARFDRRVEGARSLFQAPSAEFPLGLDWQGRSVLSHVVYGGRVLIITSIQAGLMATAIAVLLGSVAALVGGWVDGVLSGFANFILTIPQFPLLLVLASFIQFTDPLQMAALFGFLNWPTLMRAVRAQVLSLRERDYVEAAFALDLGLWHIITREVFPNMVSYVAVNLIFTVRTAMYGLVALVVLGIVPLSEPDWGMMIFMGRSQGALFSPEAAWMMLAPIFAIALFQLSLVLFARSLEEVFNPRLRSGL
ncbi:MAG: ABC transporter permease [Anaerolineae bacterium]|jgi:peptide/nickel transport system permease protein|nr:ABC transporter permease [Anaerolineae bacterium]